jgi:hypothetical protein
LPEHISGNWFYKKTAGENYPAEPFVMTQPITGGEDRCAWFPCLRLAPWLLDLRI